MYITFECTTKADVFRLYVNAGVKFEPNLSKPHSIDLAIDKRAIA